jgi:hypothetical protein
MPPDGKLADSVIEDFLRWIAMGAPDPREKAPGLSASKRKGALKNPLDHWAYRPITRYPVPAPRNDAWSRSDIDRFILAGLQEKGLEPARDADRHTWLRRVTFDVVGLPPTPKEIRDFVTDDSPLAEERLVDRLLESQHFGERWGRHWLDMVSYADTIGVDRSIPAPQAWRYRDYVIRSFNEDKPFDQFITEQLAGDLLPYQSVSQRRE